MTVGTMELHATVYAAWNEGGLDWVCKQHWPATDRSRYPALGDGMLGPGCPFPYVAYELSEAEVVTRMTGSEVGFKRAIKRTLLRLSIYAKQLPSGGMSAKAIAAAVLDSLMQVFGGHPTVRPKQLTCDSSNFLNCQYENDYGMALDDDIYQHVVNYRLLIDSSVGI